MFVVLLTSCFNVLQQLSDKHIATIVEMGFTIQQATTALQHSGGSLDVALNSLLPSDQHSASTNGVAGHSGRESRTTSSTVTSNGPVHRSDRADTRSHRPASDSSHNDRTGVFTRLILCFCTIFGSCLLKIEDRRMVKPLTLLQFARTSKRFP